MADTPFTPMGKLIAELAAGREQPPSPLERREKAIWRAVAGDAIADHTVIYPEDKVWRIIADAPIWRHAIKQREGEFLAALNKQDIHIQQFRVEIRPRESHPAADSPPAPPKNKLLDEDTAKLLASASENLRSKDLAEAIKRLSRLGPSSRK
jgi:hypothetical protein